MQCWRLVRNPNMLPSVIIPVFAFDERARNRLDTANKLSLGFAVERNICVWQFGIRLPVERVCELTEFGADIFCEWHGGSPFEM